MKLDVVRYLYYYEVPTVMFCQDDRQNNFVFCLFTEDPYEYIGKRVALEDLIRFFDGTMDLKPIYEDQQTNFYLGRYQSDGEFYADTYRGAYGDNLLPDDGLMLIHLEEELAASLKNDIINRQINGSSQSQVGQLERHTQDRVVKLMQHELGYRYLGNWQNRENSNLEEGILWEWLLKRYDEKLVTKAIMRLSSAAASQGQSLYDANKAVYELLRYGVSVQAEIGKKNETVWFIDWEYPHKNDFAIAEEVTIGRQHKKRPDIVLYVNGIALGVLELKRSTVSVSEGIRQNLDNQRHNFIKPFFNTIQYIMAGNDTQGIRYGAVDPNTNKEKYYLRWKEVDEVKDKGYPHLLELTKPIRDKTAQHDCRLDRNIIEMLNKERFLELIHDFVVYDRGTKKLCRPNQYFGIKSAQDFIRRREGGIIWHTQGSGKSLTMVWLTKWIRQYNPNARVLVITDRDELDEQIKKVYTGVNENIYRTSNGRDLLTKLNDTSPWLLCSLIHKFGGKEEGDDKAVDTYVQELRSSIPGNYKAKGDIYVFVDECHRTQSDKLHDAMKEFVPDGLFIGFTGTPLLKSHKKTSHEVFGRYIHTYKFDEAVADKVVLDLRYEARNIEQKITADTRIDEWFDLKTRGLTDYAKAELKQKWGTIKKVFSSKSRLEKIVMDVILDMERKERLQNGRGNAMLVSDSIYNACRYYELFQQAGLNQCAVVTSFDPNDAKGEETGEGHTEKLQRVEIYQKMLASYFNETPEAALKKVKQFETEVKKKFVEEPAQMKLLIVVNKLLTGFDAPSATYLYIDKKLRDHGLFQAVCRVNRLDGDDKDYGYVVDYMDLFKSLEKAFNDFTSEAFSGYAKEDINGLLQNRLQKGKERLDDALETVKALVEPVAPPQDTPAYIRYFCGEDTENPDEIKDTENPDEIKDTEPRRVALYKQTIALIRAYANIADELNEAGYSDKETQQIRADSKHFENIRKEIQLASGDYIDLKQYEPAMRHLIDSYIGAEESRILASFNDLSLIELLVERGENALDALPDSIQKSPDAMAEVIENNLRKVIIEKSPANPLYYEKMSVLLDELIRMRREAAIEYSNYLQRIIDLSGIVKQPAITKNYPTTLNTDAERALYDNLGKNETMVVELNNIILKTKKDGWRDNPQKTKAVRLAIINVLGKHDVADELEIQRIMDLINSQHDY